MRIRSKSYTASMRPVSGTIGAYAWEVWSSDTMPGSRFVKIRDFVEEQASKHPEHPAVANMLSSEPHGFLSLIDSRSRWTTDSGEITIVLHDGAVVGVSCVEHSQIHPRLAIGGIRAWLDDKHRAEQLMGKCLLEANLQWSSMQEKWAMMLTFNDYNKWIYDGVARIHRGKAVGIGGVWSDWWKDCIPIKNQLTVRYTQQWCVIKPIWSIGSGMIIKALNRE